MPRPIWNGTISFGLLNIPIQLMPGERRTDIHFRMLDGRDQSPVRYERVNAETGEEVPWKEIVKAFEYDKGSYVVIEEEDLKEAASESREIIELEAFVDRASISPAYLEKPYVLVPHKKAEKGYVLLREVLRKSGRVGIGRVVIRTREYLSMLTPHEDALVLILLRFPQELVDVADYRVPEGPPSKWKVSAREMEMANALVDAMSSDWNPGDYKDEFRERLSAVIDKRIKSKGAVRKAAESEPTAAEGAATNVVDFMSLLRDSLAKGSKGAGSKSGKAKAAKTPKSSKSTAGKSPARKSA